MAKAKLSKDEKQAVLKGIKKTPHLDEVAQHFFSIVGGPRAFAKLLHQEFRRAKEGSLNRSRILAYILDITKFANQANSLVDDLSLLSEEDLGRELEASVSELSPNEPPQEAGNP